jgi:DNA polymerase-3 subunit alpha
MAKFKPMACGFHSHLDYSLDGASNAVSKIKRASELGRIADCVTDHGVMSGLASHWFAAEKMFKDKKISSKIQSIHGIEAYVIDPHRPWKEFKNGKKEPSYYHLTIHFKTVRAYEYFCKLTPIMEERVVVKFGEAKPLLFLEELEPIAGEITIGSGCLVGCVQQNIMRGRSDLAVQMYERLRNLAGPGNFFVEVFPHIVDKDWVKPVFDKHSKEIIKPGYFAPARVRLDENAIDKPEECCAGETIDKQKKPNLFVIEMAKKYNDPIVISLDDHFAYPDDVLVQEARLGNGMEKWKFSNTYASYSSDDCAQVLQKQLGVSDKDIESWIDNSYLFVENFKDYKMLTAKDRWLLPTTDMVYDVQTAAKTNKEIVWELVQKHGRMPKEDSPEYQVYKDRYDYEIEVLADNPKKDFLPYFFVIEDVVSYFKSIGKISNARGSGGGCLVAYLLGICVTDPIKYDLPFERFITIGRIESGSLPDMDTDWPDRDEVLQYLHKKYGNRFALIATDMMLKLKSSILDVERAILGHVRKETSEMCSKHIAGAPQGVTDKDWVFGYTDKESGAHVPGFIEEKSASADIFRQYVKENPDIWKSVQKCIGIIKSRGVHAGGLVITPEPVENYMPIMMSKSGYRTVAYNMKDLESLGGVKYDFLGVSTLKAMAISLNSINQVAGQKLEWGEFPHDVEVYRNTSHAGKLEGVFQLSTPTMRPYVLKIKPVSIEDNSAIAALVRPGALDAPSPDPNDIESKSAAEYFVKCAQGLRKPYYIHPDLEPILKNTYGVVVYQEQPLHIFREFAGYSYAEAEEVRRGIGKKIKELLEKHLGILKIKLLERGWNESQADRLCQTIIASSRYSFNKAHSASYGIVSYNGCYLKYHYPLHFWKGELEVNGSDHEKLSGYLHECKQLLLPVDVFASHPTEWKIEGNKLRAPLAVIKGCGEKGVDALRKFIEYPLEGLDITNVVD